MNVLYVLCTAQSSGIHSLTCYKCNGQWAGNSEAKLHPTTNRGSNSRPKCTRATAGECGNYESSHSIHHSPWNSKRKNQSAAYTITPLYHFEEGQQIFTGYEVSNAITVHVSDPERVGLIIDTAVENGANRISNIQFKVDHADAYYQQALSLALHNAQAKAKTIAETMHLPLQLFPTEIVEEQVHTPILYRSMAISPDMTPIEQGQIDINASVRVNFQY